MLYNSFFSTSLDRVSGIFPAAPLVWATDSSKGMVSIINRLHWRIWSLWEGFHLRISLSLQLSDLITATFWEKKVTLIAESSFKSNTFGTQGILTPVTSDSACATLDQKYFTSGHSHIVCKYVPNSLLLHNVQMVEQSWSWRWNYSQMAIHSPVSKRTLDKQ